jgi:hypothetical protein
MEKILVTLAVRKEDKTTEYHHGRAVNICTNYPAHPTYRQGVEGPIGFTRNPYEHQTKMTITFDGPSGSIEIEASWEVSKALAAMVGRGGSLTIFVSPPSEEKLETKGKET